jgi:hypothetical protein
LLDNFVGVLFNRCGCLFRATVIEEAITTIHDGKHVERVELHAVRLFPRHDCRRCTNRAGSESGTRPVGRRRIEGHTDDRHIDVRHVIRVLAAHERQRAAVGGLRRRALQVLPK